MATIDLRLTRDGRARWRARVRTRGRCQSATFGSRLEAERWALEVETAVAADSRTVADKGQLSFGRLLDLYLAQGSPSDDTRRHLEWWRLRLGPQAAQEVSRGQILDLRNELRAPRRGRAGRRSPATVNRYMSALSGLFAWARRARWLEGHPLRGVAPLDEGPGRFRRLSDVERERLVAACRRTGGARLEALVVLALSTGARRGELLRLRWSDLAPDGCTVSLSGGRRQRGRTLPLPGVVSKLLRQLARVRHIDSDHLFADPQGRVTFPRQAWRRALAMAQIEDLRFNDLRHSTAACLGMNGASLAEIAETLGSRSLRTVRRYAHLAGPGEPAAIRRMQDRLFGG